MDVASPFGSGTSQEVKATKPPANFVCNTQNTSNENFKGPESGKRPVISFCGTAARRNSCDLVKYAQFAPTEQVQGALSVPPSSSAVWALARLAHSFLQKWAQKSPFPASCSNNIFQDSPNVLFLEGAQESHLSFCANQPKTCCLIRSGNLLNELSKAFLPRRGSK